MLTNIQRELIESQIELARMVACKASRKLNVAYDDCLSWAYMGLMESAKTWNKNKGASFKTHCVNKVYKHVIDEWRRYSGCRSKSGSEFFNCVPDADINDRVKSYSKSAEDIAISRDSARLIFKSIDGIKASKNEKRIFKIILRKHCLDSYTFKDLEKIYGKNYTYFSYVNTNMLARMRGKYGNKNSIC